MAVGGGEGVAGGGVRVWLVEWVRVWLVEGVKVWLVEGVRRLVCGVELTFMIQFSMLILACTLHRLEMLIVT